MIVIFEMSCSIWEAPENWRRTDVVIVFKKGKTVKRIRKLQTNQFDVNTWENPRKIIKQWNLQTFRKEQGTTRSQ